MREPVNESEAQRSEVVRLLITDKQNHLNDRLV